MFDFFFDVCENFLYIYFPFSWHTQPSREADDEDDYEEEFEIDDEDESWVISSAKVIYF